MLSQWASKLRELNLRCLQRRPLQSTFRWFGTALAQTGVLLSIEVNLTVIANEILLKWNPQQKSDSIQHCKQLEDRLFVLMANTHLGLKNQMTPNEAKYFGE